MHRKKKRNGLFCSPKESHPQFSNFMTFLFWLQKNLWFFQVFKKKLWFFQVFLGCFVFGPQKMFSAKGRHKALLPSKMLLKVGWFLKSRNIALYLGTDPVEAGESRWDGWFKGLKIRPYFGYCLEGVGWLAIMERCFCWKCWILQNKERFFGLDIYIYIYIYIYISQFRAWCMFPSKMVDLGLGGWDIFGGICGLWSWRN